MPRTTIANKRSSASPVPTGTELSPVIPDDIGVILGKPPVIIGEEIEDYNELLAQISVAGQPKDAIEWLLFEDVASLVWEAQRLRRMKAKLLETVTKSALEQLISPIVGHDRAKALFQNLSPSKPSDLAKIGSILGEAGLDLDVVAAKAMEIRIGHVERIDRMLENANKRRDVVLREIERRREIIAERRRDLPDVIDVEVTR